MKQFWRIWAKALGEKANQNADAVALVRTLLITQAKIKKLQKSNKNDNKNRKNKN